MMAPFSAPEAHSQCLGHLPTDDHTASPLQTFLLENTVFFVMTCISAAPAQTKASPHTVGCITEDTL